MEYASGDGSIALLGSIADAADLHAGSEGHSRRVAAHTRAILDALAISGAEARTIWVAARLHDLGKLGLPRQHLTRSGPLVSEAWALVRSHPQRGADYLSQRPDMQQISELILAHHERIDGSGYPHGLRGTAIPLGARIIAVADGYDAMTSDRPYRKGLLLATAITLLSQGAGTQWDRALVALFLSDVLPVLLEQGRSAGSIAAAACTVAGATPAAEPLPDHAVA